MRLFLSRIFIGAGLVCLVGLLVWSTANLLIYAVVGLLAGEPAAYIIVIMFTSVIFLIAGVLLMERE